METSYTIEISTNRNWKTPSGTSTYKVRNAEGLTLGYVRFSDRYDVTHVIAKDTFLVVAAIDRPTGQHVAIKVILLNTSFNDTYRVLREIRIMKAVGDHPFILPLIDASFQRNLLTLVTPRLLFDLHNALHEKYILGLFDQPVDTNSDSWLFIQKLLMNQLLRALAHLHAVGIMHRDIRPENILVGMRGALSLMDFGDSCGFSRINKEMSCAVGNPPYTAPEILLNGRQNKRLYTEAVDVWSLGCVFAEILGQQRPGQALFAKLDYNGSPSYNANHYFEVVAAPEDVSCLRSLKWRSTRMMIHNKALQQKRSGVDHWNRFRSFFPEDVPDIAVDLVERMLRFDPSERITAADALKHPFMAEVTIDVLRHHLGLSDRDVEILQCADPPKAGIEEEEIKKLSHDDNVDRLKILISQECQSFQRPQLAETRGKKGDGEQKQKEYMKYIYSALTNLKRLLVIF